MSVLRFSAATIAKTRWRGDHAQSINQSTMILGSITALAVIACDKREAFAQGSESGEAIQTFLVASGLLHGACHRARIRATRWLAMTIRLQFIML